MDEQWGVIEVDMFSEDVGDPEHPVAQSFRELLDEVAGQHGCRVTHFAVERGTVSFSFDSEELTAKILKVLHLSGEGGGNS